MTYDGFVVNVPGPQLKSLGFHPWARKYIMKGLLPCFSHVCQAGQGMHGSQGA